MKTNEEFSPFLPGLKPVLELLMSAPHKIDVVYCRKNVRSPELVRVQELCRKHKIRFCLEDTSVLNKLCQRGHGQQSVAHQGLVARLTTASFISLEKLLDSVRTSPLPLVVALDQVQDPGNVGTLARTLYALGGAGFIVPAHNGVYLGPAAQRSAAGALEHLPIARVTNLARALEQCTEAGLSIYGATGTAEAHNAFNEPWQLPAVLVLGNEDKGLRPGVLKRCNKIIRIPHARNFDSLNVAQAGAILIALTVAGHLHSLKL